MTESVDQGNFFQPLINNQKLLARGGLFMFFLGLIAWFMANHRIIGCSEMYSGTTAMEKGIKSVMKNGAATKINDTT